jgi:YHS domain-containing protein
MKMKSGWKYLALLVPGIWTLMGCSQEKTGPAAPPTGGPPAAGATGGTTPPAATGGTPTVAPRAPVSGAKNSEGRAVCSVCYVKEGRPELEEVKASLNYKGKTYYFCTLADKAEFISNPTKYASAIK